MKKICYFLLFLFLGIIKINAQRVIRTDVNINEIISKFSERNTIQWEIPISENQRINLLWEERKTSFSQEGVRSFVGYNGHQLVASLSFIQGNISGSIFTEKGEFQLTNINGFLHLISPIKHTTCLSHQREEKNITRSYERVLIQKRQN